MNTELCKIISGQKSHVITHEVMKTKEISFYYNSWLTRILWSFGW